MKLTDDEKKDKNVFKQIITENWERFKKKYPSYNKPYYEETIQKHCFVVQNRVDILSTDAYILYTIAIKIKY